MRIYLDGPFDLGAVYGVGDEAFDGQAAALLQAARETFGDAVDAVAPGSAAPDADVDDLSAAGYALTQPFGVGARLRVRGGPLIDGWRADALRFVDHTREDIDERFGEGAATRVAALLRSIKIRDVTIFLFGVGAGSARLRTGPFETATPEDAVALFHALEYAGYGDAAPTDGAVTANALLAAFRTKARALLRRRPSVKLTDRAPDQDAVDIRGFQGVIALERQDAHDVADPRFYATRDEAAQIPYGHGEIGVTWLFVVFKESDAFEINLPRFLALYLTARTAWDVSWRVEKQYNELLERRLAARLSEDARPPLDRRDLSLLKSLAQFIVAATTLRTVTASAGDLAFLERYEGFARIEERQAGLRAAQTALESAEEEEIFQIEARRSRRLGGLLAVLTVLSLVGVVAGVVSAWRDGVSLLGGAIPLGLALIAPAALGLLAMAALGERRRR